MAKKFLTPVGLPTGASLPAVGETGQLFYNTTDSLVYQYNGTAWVSVGSGTGGTREYTYLVSVFK